MRRIGKIALFLLKLSIILYVVFYFGIDIYKKNLFQKVDAGARSELEKIELSNELVEEEINSQYGCSYSYKLNAMRCNTHYVRFYGTNGNLISKFKDTDNYLESLGWKSVFSANKNKERIPQDEGLVRSYNAGYTLSRVYTKDSDLGYIDLLLSFYGKNAKEGDSDNGITKMINKYSPKYESIYSVSISTDIQ